MDRQVGSVLAALEQAGHAENTLIVYCSDHGEMLGGHGMWWKNTFYDGASRVPFVISWPGVIPEGVRRRENMSLLDVGPTLLDLCGVDPLPGADGRSFRPVLLNEDLPHDDVVFAEDTLGGPSRMVRSGPWKYNYYHENAPELFNMEEDPGELRNLAGVSKYRSVEESLRDLVLKDWDPNAVIDSLSTLAPKRRLIAGWIRSAGPPEPDPVWFAEPPENWVDPMFSWGGVP